MTRGEIAQRCSQPDSRLELNSYKQLQKVGKERLRSVLIANWSTLPRVCDSSMVMGQLEWGTNQ